MEPSSRPFFHMPEKRDPPSGFFGRTIVAGGFAIVAAVVVVIAVVVVDAVVRVAGAEVVVAVSVAAAGGLGRGDDAEAGGLLGATFVGGGGRCLE